MPNPIEPVSLANALRQGDRQALAKAITLVESTRKDHRRSAIELLGCLTPDRERTFRLGISGVPGVGKSTFIESFGCHLIEQGHRVAVLTIDPTSAHSGGSILGDKTRMTVLSQHPNAYIRPSPTRGALGGVARRTRESILICEAAGFDVVVVETVGVGQSEFAVSNMTDMFILLLLPGGGDELQGIKRGIMELADLVLVNKADGVLEKVAQQTSIEYANALRLVQPRSSSWTVPVGACSALENIGIQAAWQHVASYRDTMVKNGELHERRSQQSRQWLWDETIDGLVDTLRNDPEMKLRVTELEAAVMAGDTLACEAAQELVRGFCGDRQYQGGGK